MATSDRTLLRRELAPDFGQGDQQPLSLIKKTLQATEDFGQRANQALFLAHHAVQVSLQVTVRDTPDRLKPMGF